MSDWENKELNGLAYVGLWVWPQSAQTVIQALGVYLGEQQHLAKLALLQVQRISACTLAEDVIGGIRSWGAIWHCVIICRA